MSHTNGRIYVDANGGIDFRGDVAFVLGLSTGDEWTLYNHSNVKMWSRYKPVPWSINGVKNLNPAASHPTDWHKGINADFGITPKSADTSNVLSYLDGNLNGWVYSRDTLAARVLDFNGYYHNAENPFDYLFLQADRDAVAPGGTITFQYQLRAGGGATDYSLGIIELNSRLQVGGVYKAISDLYAAFIIYQKSGNSYIYYDWVSASQTLSDLESDPAMHAVAYTAPTTTGDYKYVPVLTTFKKESSSQAISSFITIPGTNAVEFTVATNVNPYVQVDAFVINSGTSENPNYNNTIYFYCTLFGGTNGGSFNNIYLAFETGQGVAYKTLTNVQNGGTAGAVTVSANSNLRLPSGSGNVYSTTWTSSTITLESLVRSLGGNARIYCNTSGTSIPSYSVPIREAAGMPGGTVTPFNQ